MISIIDINVQNIEKEQETGDAYYTLQVKLMEPGAAFAEEIPRETIKKTVKNSLSSLNSVIRG